MYISWNAALPTHIIIMTFSSPWVVFWTQIKTFLLFQWNMKQKKSCDIHDCKVTSQTLTTATRPWWDKVHLKITVVAKMKLKQNWQKASKWWKEKLCSQAWHLSRRWCQQAGLLCKWLMQPLETLTSHTASYLDINQEVADHTLLHSTIVWLLNKPALVSVRETNLYIRSFFTNWFYVA